MSSIFVSFSKHQNSKQQQNKISTIRGCWWDVKGAVRAVVTQRTFANPIDTLTYTGALVETELYIALLT